MTAPATATETEFAEWCEALASRVRAGDTLRLALASTPCPPAVETSLGTLRLRMQRGSDLVTACTAAIDTLDAQPRSARPSALREILGVIRVCALGSAHTARTLDRVALHLRVRAALREEVRAQTAAARLSARLLTGLPIAAIGLTTLITPASARVFTTWPGLICLVVSAAMNLIGWIWIRSLLRRAET